MSSAATHHCRLNFASYGVRGCSFDSAGSHTINVAYSGDGNSNGSNGTLSGSYVVSAANTTTSVMATPASGDTGRSFT